MGRTISKRNMAHAMMLDRYGPGRGAGGHSPRKVLTCQEHRIAMPEGYCPVCEEMLTEGDNIEVDE